MIHRLFSNRVLTGSIILLAGLIVLQLFPSQYQGYTNPPVVAEPAWDSPETRALAVRACYDCHSNETEWLWYTYIAPFSWLIKRDVYLGRDALNFSEWPPEDHSDATAEESVELISKRLMPLPYYLLLHPEAKLSTSERGQLITGIMKTFEEDMRMEADQLDESERLDE